MGLKGGAIAGIVIGCVVFVVAKTACKSAKPAMTLLQVHCYRILRILLGAQHFCPSSTGR